MAKPLFHAVNSARKFGGKAEDYQLIHCKIDESKSAFPKMSHRIVLHSNFGSAFCEELFGKKIINSDKVQVSVKDIADQHTIEDLGFIPTLEDWFKELEAANATKAHLTKTPYMSTDKQCRISARSFGGNPEEYQHIHQKMNGVHEDPAGKVIFHSAYGIYLIEDLFGVGFVNSVGRLVSVREVAEQHVLRAMQKIPTLEEWIIDIEKPWMAGIRKTKLVIVD